MREKTQGFLTEFKAFAMRGNVIDLAVGVVMGTAFKTIVSSLVDDIIMPLIGALVGGTDFKNLKIILSNADTENPAILAYGQFIQNIVDFIIIAFSIFIMVKVISKLNRKKEEEKAIVEEVKEPELTREEVLLTEIRDLLKK